MEVSNSQTQEEHKDILFEWKAIAGTRTQVVVLKSSWKRLSSGEFIEKQKIASDNGLEQAFS